MIYWFFHQLNPLVPTLLICPLIAIIIGIICSFLHFRILLGVGIAIVLPLLFITTNIDTFKSNLDAWAMYGIIYALITYASFRITSRARR
ncbi:hypothetical protein [Paenibacillus sp. 1-18]|uniref:Uncharacterized protein n=1 Tax=Paenibacillus brasilensis TaxID=128574 RepID=A0ABU0KYQ9_9BACL|nr:hypothetical protein [Paenibacillus sp. 1-18]MDQ0494586.1 hypothetical protein [Paenibacillus brasilensis]